LIADELNIKNIIWSVDLPQEVLDNPKSMKGSMDYKIALDTVITDTLRDEGDMREFVRTIQDMRKTADLVPSDRVSVNLTHAEPAWFAGELGRELMQTVGADRVVWGSSEDVVQKL
jgi:predicted TIM-barrel fold metal-dependent hydrolase